MGQTITIQVEGGSSSVRLLETDIGATGGTGIIGQRRNYSTPIAGSAGGGSIFFPSAVFKTIGEKHLYSSFQNNALTNLTGYIRAKGFWGSVPLATIFVSTGLSVNHTLAAQWRFKITAKTTASNWPLTNEKCYLRWKVYKSSDMSNELVRGSFRLSVLTLTDFVNISSYYTGSISTTDQLCLKIEAGYFNTTPL